MKRLAANLSREERQRAIANEQARVRRIVDRFLAGRAPLELRPSTAATVFLYESIHTNPYSDDASKTKVGRFILDASDGARRLMLLTSLAALVRAPMAAPSWQPNVFGNIRLVHDYRLGGLIKAILRTRPTISDEFARAILVSLSALAGRFDSDLPTNSYHFPCAALLRFIEKAMPVPSSSLLPVIGILRDAVREAVANDLVALKGYDAAEAKQLSANPGRWFTKKDREAIELIERWASSKAARSTK